MNLSAPQQQQPNQGIMDWINPLNWVGLGYNIYSGERANDQWVKQQEWENAFAREQFEYNKEMATLNREREDNAVQRRLADLQAAGLHGSLAVGGAAATMPASSNVSPASAGAPPQNHVSMGDILLSSQLAKMRADVSLTQAEASRVRNQTLLDNRQMAVNERLANMHQTETNIKVSENDRQQNNFEWEQTIRDARRQGLDLENTLRKRSITKTELENALSKIDLEYLKLHHVKMPTGTSLYGQIYQALEHSGITRNANALADWIADFYTQFLTDAFTPHMTDPGNLNRSMTNDGIRIGHKTLRFR